MESILIPTLLLLASIALFYLVYQSTEKTTPKGLLWVITEEFFSIIATVFFGMFGFSWDQFIERLDEGN
ncbi:MAG: hypothetical protein AAF927_17125 [Bacteroidota bacterium]